MNSKLHISYISDECVSDDKSGQLGQVGELALDTFGDLVEASLTYHIAVGTFAEGRRHGAYFKSADILGFDFDDGTSSEKVHLECACRGWTHIIMASKNHLKDKGDGKGIVERFHLFIPYRSESKDDYKYAAKKISDINDWTTDKNCTDCTRYFYRHSKVLYSWLHGNGIRREYIQRFKDLERMFAELKPKPSVRLESSGLDGFKRTKAYEKLTSNLTTDGGRYAESSSIIGVMIKCGLSESECLSLFDEYATYGDGFTRESVSRRFNQWR